MPPRRVMPASARRTPARCRASPGGRPRRDRRRSTGTARHPSTRRASLCRKVPDPPPGLRCVVGVLRQKDEPGRRRCPAAGRSKSTASRRTHGDLDEDPRPVARVLVRTLGSAVVEVLQSGYRLVDEPVRASWPSGPREERCRRRRARTMGRRAPSEAGLRTALLGARATRRPKSADGRNQRRRHCASGWFLSSSSEPTVTLHAGAW